MSKGSIATVAVGLMLLVGSPLLWSVSQPADTVGEPPTEAAPEAAPPEPPERTTLTPTQPTTQSPPPESGLTDAQPPAEPVRLQIPAIDVHAGVDATGLDDDGGMEIPHDIARVGWYEPGVRVGAERGTAVLSGHVDSREQGTGAFFELRSLDVDDRVLVEHADGSSSEWRVTARTVYPKDELPIAEIFTRFSEPRLVLITCGGAFDNTERSYEDNVVVYTEPVEARP